MKDVLSKLGIEFEEIPRKCLDNEAISASKVRKVLKEKNWEEIKKMVPECTFNFLYKNYSQTIKNKL